MSGPRCGSLAGRSTRSRRRLAAAILLAVAAWLPRTPSSTSTFVMQALPRLTCTGMRSGGLAGSRRHGLLAASAGAEDVETKPSTEVKTDGDEASKSKKDADARLQKKEKSPSALQKKEEEDFRPLEAFYEPSENTIVNSLFTVAGAVLLGGGGFLLATGIDADYYILIFIFVVIAFGFLAALAALKAITPEPQGDEAKATGDASDE
eukprot:TRINITY_DN88020_c0_g1_i1.p1 TRINITY_DN88020_c0_g1~~TRINITY_DN88020_c0_g1_i1.p1  ORF type:complete len:207 (+),score=38.31 TRINITY_DN88020_c0_g1_i1:60-680(+)